MKSNNSPLKEYGFIAHYIERFFRLLQFFPPQYFLNNRSDFHNQTENLTVEDFKLKTKQRSLKVDFVISAFLAIEIILVILIIAKILVKKSDFEISPTIALILISLRLISIIESSVNMTLFDSLRIKKENHFTASLVRSLVLTLVNYLELIIIFGIFYALIPNGQLKGLETISDYFYFSAITQLTIGYGDLTPSGFLRFICVIQGLTSFYFTILIIGRFIGLMPKIKEVEERDSLTN